MAFCHDEGGAVVDEGGAVMDEGGASYTARAVISKPVCSAVAVATATVCYGGLVG